MSIETVLEELYRTITANTEALERNTEALTRATFASHADGLASKYITGVSIPETKAAVEPDKEDISSTLAIIEEATNILREEKPVLKYEDMVTAFRQFIGKHGRDKAAEVLTSFGITGKLTQDQLPEDQYQAFLDKLK